MIRFVDIVKSFGPKAVLEGVSFDVRPGEVFFIIGASGVGKSVLIKHLVGLLYPDEGEIWLDGSRTSRSSTKPAWVPVRKKCAMVFQHSTLLRLDDLRRERRAATCASTKNTELTKKLVRRGSCSDSMSVRMKDPSRTAYPGRARRRHARSAWRSHGHSRSTPKYVLFDEPTTSLDPVSARRVDKLIRRALRRELGVTSDRGLPRSCRASSPIADRIVMLYKRTRSARSARAKISEATDDGVIQQFINGRADWPDGSLTGRAVE